MAPPDKTEPEETEEEEWGDTYLYVRVEGDEVVWSWGLDEDDPLDWKGLNAILQDIVVVYEEDVAFPLMTALGLLWQAKEHFAGNWGTSPPMGVKRRGGAVTVVEDGVRKRALGESS